MEPIEIDLSNIDELRVQFTDGTEIPMAEFIAAGIKSGLIKQEDNMNDKERYLVCTTDGKSHTVVARTFGEVEKMFGEANIWQMIRLDFEEEKK